MFIMFFFFSSRRRHTRFDCDWSSDVCSSDLPRPPRQLNPKVDRDFSTICLKCLEKDPQCRYSSALALAEDLERWLEGRPISARRISAPARIWRWSRRNPKLVATGVAGLVLGAAAIWLFRSEFFQ